MANNELYKKFTEVFKKGGDIHIDPKNKGKFTASAKRAGMGVQEFARHVLANKDKYSATQVKRANFARNAKHFKHQDGGEIIYGGEIDPVIITADKRPSPRVGNKDATLQDIKDLGYSSVVDYLKGSRNWERSWHTLDHNISKWVPRTQKQYVKKFGQFSKGWHEGGLNPAFRPTVLENSLIKWGNDITQTARRERLTQESLNAENNMSELASEVAGLLEYEKASTAALENLNSAYEELQKNQNNEVLVNKYNDALSSVIEKGILTEDFQISEEYNNNMNRLSEVYPEYVKKLNLIVNPELKKGYEFASYFPGYDTYQQWLLDLNGKSVPKNYFATNEEYDEYVKNKNRFFTPMRTAFVTDALSLIPYGGWIAKATKLTGKPLLKAATKLAGREIAGNMLAYGINRGLLAADRFGRENWEWYANNVPGWALAATMIATNVAAPVAISKGKNLVENKYYYNLANKNGGLGNAHLKPDWSGELKIDKIEYPNGYIHKPLFFRPSNVGTISIDAPTGGRQYFDPYGQITTPIRSMHGIKDLKNGVSLLYPLKNIE